MSTVDMAPIFVSETLRAPLLGTPEPAAIQRVLPAATASKGSSPYMLVRFCGILIVTAGIAFVGSGFLIGRETPNSLLRQEQPQPPLQQYFGGGGGNGGAAATIATFPKPAATIASNRDRH